MNCTLFEQVAFVTFAISMIMVNLASWRMQRYAKLEGYSGPQWKLLLGDVALPKSVLSGAGGIWRGITIASFVFLVLSGATIGVLNSQGNQCFGLSS